jgi:hypothetical protein
MAAADQRETNIKKEYIDKLMALREAEAKKARQLKKKQAYKPDGGVVFLVGEYANARQTLTSFLLTPRRGKAFTVCRRARFLFLRRFFDFHYRALDAVRLLASLSPSV